MKKSKNKGSKFEREICRILTNWVTGKRNPVIFWRTASSGGQFVQTKGRGSRMAGDIIAIDGKGSFLTNRYCIECKFHKKIDFKELLSDKKGLIKQWWWQVEDNAVESKKEPMLIFKGNNTPIYIMIYSTEQMDLEHYTGRIEIPTVKWIESGRSKSIFQLKDFLKQIEIETIKQLGKEDD